MPNNKKTEIQTYSNVYAGVSKELPHTISNSYEVNDCSTARPITSNENTVPVTTLKIAIKWARQMKQRSKKYRAVTSSGNIHKRAIRVKYIDEQGKRNGFYVTFYKDMKTCWLEKEKLESKL